MKNAAPYLLLVAVIGVLSYALLPVFLPGGQGSAERRDLPWQIEIGGDGASTVFGLTLGESTVQDAVKKLGRRYELGLFHETGGRIALEAYFRDTVLGGLNARVVAVADLDQDTLRAMLARAGEGKRLPGGGQQYPVSRADTPAALAAPIAALTYVPYVKLDAALILKRFGEPAERLVVDATSSHWLYPERGLGLTLKNEERSVLQYVAPRDFDALRALLATLPPTDDP